MYIPNIITAAPMEGTMMSALMEDLGLVTNLADRTAAPERVGSGTNVVVVTTAEPLKSADACPGKASNRTGSGSPGCRSADLRTTHVGAELAVPN